jgi:hypothetical protein
MRVAARHGIKKAARERTIHPRGPSKKLAGPWLKDSAAAPMEANMRFPKHTARFAVAAALGALVVPASLAFAQGKVSPCPDPGRSDRPSHCEVREFDVPVTGNALSIDATPNGGISVRGWDRAGIQVRARVTANAETQPEADAMAAEVRVLTDGGRIRSEGRRPVDHGGWSVSFEVMAPAQHGLTLRTTNGGISVKDVQSRIELQTTNGGITLANVNGEVLGHTTNGGVQIELSGDTWLGQGLDVQTQNGGVRLAVPEGYSAHLEAATRNGGVRCDFPVTVQGTVGKDLSADLGHGGAPLKVRTVNGGVTIVRR